MNKEKIFHKIIGHIWKPAEKGFAICKVCGKKEEWTNDYRLNTLED